MKQEMIEQELLKVEYTDRPVTAWGGMRLMKELLVRSGIMEFMEELDLPQPGSNRGYQPTKILEAFWASIWMGASRFIHADWLRYDEVLQQIFGWKQVPSASTYSRFFHKFSWQRNDAVFPRLQRWFMQLIELETVTIDLDSTVVTRYGQQEGAQRGYNPHKPGRPSHHPLLAFLSQTRMVVNAWLRPGNTAASTKCCEFLEETFEILRDRCIGLVRGDSGFYSNKIMSWLERRDVGYIIAAKFFEPLRNEILYVRDWVEIAEGIQVGELWYQPLSWQQARRFVVVRKSVDRRPKAAGKLLFPDEPQWRFSAVVTNLELPADAVWQLYRQRADAENRIKELKYDFGVDNFCLKRFWATEAAFRFIMVAYNLMSLFRHRVLQSQTQHTLNTLRFKCFAIGGWTAKHAGQRVLKLSVSGGKRVWLEGLFSAVGAIGPPI